MPKEIILYSAKMCGDCQKIKDFMESKGIRFEIRDILAHPEYAKEVEENTGWPIRFAQDAEETSPPTVEELEVLRSLQERTAKAHGDAA